MEVIIESQYWRWERYGNGDGDNGDGENGDVDDGDGDDNKSNIATDRRPHNGDNDGDKYYKNWEIRSLRNVDMYQPKLQNFTFPNTIMIY